MSSDGAPRRPTFLGPLAMDVQPGGLDPAERDLAAHTTARLLVEGAGDGADDETLRRLVTLTDSHGLELLAELWSGMAPNTLPGALWRLYVLRAWVHREPRTAAEEFDTGRQVTPVLEAVAGVAEPPGPEEVKELSDAVLRGAYTGDFGVALERAAAFARVVAVGRSHGHESLAVSAAKLVRMAENLESAARDWRLGELH